MTRESRVRMWRWGVAIYLASVLTTIILQYVVFAK